jgi:hypothetical protein
VRFGDISASICYMDQKNATREGDNGRMDHTDKDMD